MEHTVRDFWATRPCRRSNDRKIAGVAAAIGRRYAIDPVLVRVAFVVATTWGGGGLLLYLLGWLLLPAEGDQAFAESVVGRGRRSMSAVLTIVLVLLILVAWAVLGVMNGSNIIGLAVTLGTLFLLHRSRAGLGEVPGSRPVGAPQQSDTEPAATTPTSTVENSQRSGPPAWDPLGAAPFAWNLPDPSAQPEPITPPQGARWTLTPITLGLALLAGGIALASAPALSAVQIAAMSLGVVGLGLVAGAFMQRGRGLIFVAIPLTVLTSILSAVPVAGFKVGNSHWEPATAAQMQPRYSVMLGDSDLDLTRLRLIDSQTVKTSVAVGVGQTRVYLPPNVDAQVNCQTKFGEINCLGRSDPEGDPPRVAVTDNGSDGPGGGTLILDVHSGIGQIHVTRGSSPR
jgi:phage shock protein PspC (stress-responsive transcriptional regulator)